MNESSLEGKSQGQVHKRHMRNYLLDKGFQLKWTAIVVVVNVGICLALGVPLYRTVSAASDQLLAKDMGEPALTPAAMKVLETQNAQDKNQTILALVVLLGILVVCSTLLWIFLTHRIAGPMYKIRSIFHRVNADHLEVNTSFRKGDEFEAVLLEFNAMMGRLADGRRADIQAIEAARSALDDAATPQARQAAQAALDDLTKRYRSSLE